MELTVSVIWLVFTQISPNAHCSFLVHIPQSLQHDQWFLKRVILQSAAGPTRKQTCCHWAGCRNKIPVMWHAHVVFTFCTRFLRIWVVTLLLFIHWLILLFIIYQGMYEPLWWAGITDIASVDGDTRVTEVDTDSTMWSSWSEWRLTESLKKKYTTILWQL